ncbi:MAG: hypothetical protein A3E01_06500 [Gammaproteobacteria bacterium RIFCSPHIGHO2_12_FULL_63_22]|nr:MAG: hypothetical protein A3E01_06500 [Gammaproteobacteria bacterium RIFCSPHIGHO2_12_FULL_63_22]
MILRKLTQALREQNWTAIVIEFVLLVSGVFLGLQVATWNEQRRDRALERQYLERLREDFSLSVTGAESNIENMELQARRATLVLDRLRACRLEEGAQHAEFAAGLYVIGRLEPPTLTRGTMDELRSTGRLGIIRSVGLRQKLSNVLQQQERTVGVFGFLVARRTAQLAYIDARNTVLVPQERGATNQPGPGEVLFDFPALCGDPAFLNAVSHIRQIAYVVIRQNRRLLNEYRAMEDLLDAELGKAHR